MTDVTVLDGERFDLGEGSRWVGDRLVMVDILSGRLFATPTPVGSGELTELAKLPGPLGAVAPIGGEPGAWLAAAGPRAGIDRAARTAWRWAMATFTGGDRVTYSFPS